MKKARVVIRSRMYPCMFTSSWYFLWHFALWTSLQVSRAHWCGKPSPNACCRGACDSWKRRREEGWAFLWIAMALWIRGSYSGPCPCPLSFTCLLSRLFQPQSLFCEAFQFMEDFQYLPMRMGKRRQDRSHQWLKRLGESQEKIRRSWAVSYASIKPRGRNLRHPFELSVCACPTNMYMLFSFQVSRSWPCKSFHFILCASLGCTDKCNIFTSQVVQTI